jgi:membrane protease YdiL (CAAX protease family)
MKMPSVRHPVLILILWLAAAFVVINAGPLFIPSTASAVTPQALLWKAFGSGLFLAATFLLMGPEIRKLGLRPNVRTIRLCATGVLLGALVVSIWAIALYPLVPFHLERGTLGIGPLLGSVCIYLLGALLEELAFRGHPFVRLRQRHGPVVAVALVSLAFGILHLPGMTGINAPKIVALTGLSSVLFCLAYVRTGSLWTAIGLHAGMNVMLHSILGGGGGNGPSWLRLVVDDPAPSPIDWFFWCFILVQLACAAGLLVLRRDGSDVARVPAFRST